MIALPKFCNRMPVMANMIKSCFNGFELLSQIYLNNDQYHREKPNLFLPLIERNTKNSMKSIKTVLFVFLLSVQAGAFAQFSWAQIGVDGLTCSACTRSVEMSIRK